MKNTYGTIILIYLLITTLSNKQMDNKKNI